MSTLLNVMVKPGRTPYLGQTLLPLFPYSYNIIYNFINICLSQLVEQSFKSKLKLLNNHNFKCLRSIQTLYYITLYFLLLAQLI